MIGKISPDLSDICRKPRPIYPAHVQKAGWALIAPTDCHTTIDVNFFMPLSGGAGARE
ncbi:hypothetical protein RLO149_c002230 [Roseobacter litoralis Och 149]|uniref:Uncharacterized protein n=1 Tax=Roseobacter litoralis (strain ATCC 49566 / DSM 6996 / JCM 21268 / NBRC 15278 / OCh 149) TaxID=391595 RepID=F7ZFR4_ROSLO|nr:hypothetical protein RLO149_c002230 [Roseobacter litoralis Och 149]